MKKKIFASIFITTALVLALAVVFIVSLMRSSFSRTLEEEIRNEIVFIAEGCESSELFSTDSGIAYLEKITDGSRRISLISPEGVVVFDNFVKDLSTLDSHFDREEFIEAQTEEFGVARRRSSTFSKDTIYYAKKLSNDYVIRISAEEYSIISTIGTLTGSIILILISGALIALVMASLSAFSIVKPINMLDIENFDDNDIIYEELSPFYSKIKSQRATIKRQISKANEKQREFALITENMADGLIVLDKGANILSCNTASINMLGISEESVIGKSLLSVKRTDCFYDIVNKSMRGEHAEKTVNIFAKTLYIISNPVVESMHTAGVVIIILDITEKAQRDELRREFSANVSHELKTPLTSISGFAELLKNGMVKAEDVSLFGSKIYDESSRLVTLVNDIIKISSLDEGAKEISMERCNLAEICESAIESLQHIARKAKISLELDAEDCFVLGEADILFEVVYNLCENAIKYNKENGSVKVFVKRDGDTARLIVDDTGIGIPDEDKDRVFERFYRVDKSHSREIGGTGLGLSIVKHAVSYHDAKISLTSELGVGTKITIDFKALD